MSSSPATDELIDELYALSGEYRSIAENAIAKCEKQESLIAVQEELIKHLKERVNLLCDGLESCGHDFSSYKCPEQDLVL